MHKVQVVDDILSFYRPLVLFYISLSTSIILSHIRRERKRVDITRDAKVRALSARGDTLITIPCWWDGSEERYASSPFVNDVRVSGEYDVIVCDEWMDGFA